MLLAWKNAGIVTYAGYILGFPGDTPQSIAEDIQIIKRELPVDILEFFILTPLPGSEDHKVLWQKGAWMDPDLNKYDLEHVTAHHPKMNKGEWEGVYRAAWATYYTPAHKLTILRRAAAGMGVSRLMPVLFFFATAYPVEKLHPLQAGAFRLKYGRDRRPSLPIEPIWSFYPKLVWEVITKHVRFGIAFAQIYLMMKRAKREQRLRPYMDLAITPVEDDETETLELFTHNEGARNEVAHTRRIAALTHGVRAEASA